MRLWNISSALAAIFTAVAYGAYGTGYALHLGANNALIGLLSAAPSWGQTLQLFSPLLIERLQRRKQLCVLFYILAYSLWVPVAFIPFIFHKPAQAWALVVLVLCAGLLLAVAAPATTSWLTDLVPGQYRAAFVSRNQSIMAGVGLATSLLAGAMMDRFPESHKQTGFMLLFGAGVIFAWLSIGAFALVPEPPKAAGEPPALKDLLRLPWANREVRSLTLFTAMRTMTVMMAAPFFAAYMLKDLQIPYRQIALFSMAVTITMMATNPIWAYLADKFGHRPVLRLSSFGVALNPLFWFFVTPTNYTWVIPIAQVWGGLVAAGLLQSQFNLLLKVAPAEQRSIYLGFHNAVVSIAVGIGSLAGGALADFLSTHGPYHWLNRPVSHYQVVFLISCILRIFALQFIQKVKEPEASAALRVIRELGRGRAVEALWNLRRLSRAPDPTKRAQAARALGRSHSRLPFEELVGALEDGSHEVRLEAVRALAEIADERAVEPLLNRIRDPLYDVAEEAVEALAAIPCEASRQALVSLLEEPRPSIRRSAAQGLGRVGGAHDAGHLEALLTREREPQVILAVDESLSLIGGARNLRRLRRLLPLTSADNARRVMANGIGNLLGPKGEFYRLLSTESLEQDAQASILLRSARRAITRMPGIARPETATVRELVNVAMRAFESDGYNALSARLRRAASVALGVVAREPGQRHQLFAASERLRLSFSYLQSLSREQRYRTLDRYEGLLAVYAFSQVARELSAAAV